MAAEPTRLDDELFRAHAGAAWAGPSFRDVLADVTADAAARRHPALAHSIWELVTHTSAWVEAVRRRIAEWRAVELSEPENFPPIIDPSPAAWTAAQTELDGRVEALRDLVRGLDPTRMDEVAPGTDYPVAVMLHGTAQHLAYHAGQIALLKRLV
jgi:hypothetical protein